jgi:uncharacterized protein YndB with AHSA1/START domain
MAQTTHRFFSRETEVRIEIDAPAERVWSLLINGPDYPTWTSTVLSIEGEIAPGRKIRLKSALDPKRTFTLAVREFQPPTQLAWGDAMGRRTFNLSPHGTGTMFVMRERIGGPIFPLFARMIPSFDDSFDRFARDLKARAELT